MNEMRESNDKAGSTSYLDIMDSLENIASGNSIESIVELKTPKARFSMLEMTGLVESEGYQIALFWKMEETGYYRIILVLNTRDLKYMLRIFEENGYEVLNTMNEATHDDILKERYDHLMHYINI